MEDYKVILLRIYFSRGLNYRAFTLYHTHTHKQVTRIRYRKILAKREGVSKKNKVKQAKGKKTGLKTKSKQKN